MCATPVKFSFEPLTAGTDETACTSTAGAAGSETAQDQVRLADIEEAMRDVVDPGVK